MKPDSTYLPNHPQHKKLIHSLFIELFQTERSANVHSMREAARYPDNAPSAALMAVADHARAMAPDLRELAAARGMSETKAGMALGSLFSCIREAVADRMINSERSYRATLLGMRHGIDLVRSIRHIALAAEDFPLAMFCDGWIARRTALVEEVAARSAWFAAHPERALETGKRAVRDLHIGVAPQLSRTQA